MTLPAIAPVTVIEHLPDERVQLAGLGRVTLPVPDRVKVTVPVGEDAPDTVTVHVEVWLVAMDVGVQETVVVVAVGGVTVSVAVPELGRLSALPA